MAFEGRCSTTAMGIMPHRDVDRALELVLSLDIPFWPQLPNVSIYEDMYVQVSQNFPGITIDLDKERLIFDTATFERELDEYFMKMDRPEAFALTREYSMVFHEFLSKELQGYKAIRGQVTGPVSFGFKVLDESLKPIIYNDEASCLIVDGGWLDNYPMHKLDEYLAPEKVLGLKLYTSDDLIEEETGLTVPNRPTNFINFLLQIIWSIRHS